jgi:hypothetical protein
MLGLSQAMVDKGIDVAPPRHSARVRRSPDWGTPPDTRPGRLRVRRLPSLSRMGRLAECCGRSRKSQVTPTQVGTCRSGEAVPVVAREPLGQLTARRVHHDGSRTDLSEAGNPARSLAAQPAAGSQFAVSGQQGCGRHEKDLGPASSGTSHASAANSPGESASYRRWPTCRRSTAFSCRSTSSSAFWPVTAEHKGAQLGTRQTTIPTAASRTGPRRP